MFKQIDYTMVIVSDMERSVEFYRDKLGIPLKFQSPDWTEFQTGTTTLALHGGGVPPTTSGRRSATKQAGTCSIGFNVEDVDKTYEELKGQGHSLRDAANAKRRRGNQARRLHRSGRTADLLCASDRAIPRRAGASPSNAAGGKPTFLTAR